MTAALTTARRRAYYRFFGGDRVLANLVRPGNTVLDVGCSDGRGSEVLTGATGCDIHLPTLRDAESSGRRRPVVQADVRRLPFRSGSFDVVAALDVVEHFDKPDALQVMREMERVGRRTVVVMTPSGFVPQPPTESEPWQEHRSGFEADELKALGFQVQGIGGWARLRGDYGAFRGGVLGQLAAALSDTYVRRAPHRAFHLLAVKSTIDP